MILSTSFGIEIDSDVVRRVLAEDHRENPGGRGPSWLTFPGRAKDSLWSVDLLCCESGALKTWWVVLDQITRRIIGFWGQRVVMDGPIHSGMFNSATTGTGTPRPVGTDNDPLFRIHQWKSNLRILEIDAIKTLPFAP